MSSANLQIELPPSLMDYVEAQVEAGAFANPTEYVRTLIQDDQQRRLHDLEAHLLNSLDGPGIEIPDSVLDDGSLFEYLAERLEQKN